MKFIRQKIFNDLTLPINCYGRVIQVLRPQDYGPKWIDVGDIVYQAREVSVNFAGTIFNITRGFTYYTNSTQWRIGSTAKLPFILIERLGH